MPLLRNKKRRLTSTLSKQTRNVFLSVTVAVFIAFCTAILIGFYFTDKTMAIHFSLSKDGFDITSSMLIIIFIAASLTRLISLFLNSQDKVDVANDAENVKSDYKHDENMLSILTNTSHQSENSNTTLPLEESERTHHILEQEIETLTNKLALQDKEIKIANLKVEKLELDNSLLKTKSSSEKEIITDLVEELNNYKNIISPELFPDLNKRTNKKAAQ